MNSFEKDELIVVTNKLIYEYANVQTVDTQGVPVIRFKNNSCLSQNTTGLEVYHVPINMITMADTGHQYMGDALLKGWNRQIVITLACQMAGMQRLCTKTTGLCW